MSDPVGACFLLTDESSHPSLLTSCSVLRQQMQAFVSCRVVCGLHWLHQLRQVAPVAPLPFAPFSLPRASHVALVLAMAWASALHMCFILRNRIRAISTDPPGRQSPNWGPGAHSFCSRSRSHSRFHYGLAKGKNT